MSYINLPTKKLVKCDWNYKTDDNELLAKLISNIERNGQIENIIVREVKNNKYEIVNGNHRYDALLRLGVEEVICFNLGKITTNQAKRIAIETNETRFAADSFLLASTVQEVLADNNVDESMLPFNTMEYESFNSILDFGDYEEDEDNYTKQVNTPNSRTVIIQFDETDSKSDYGNVLLYLQENNINFKEH